MRSIYQFFLVIALAFLVHASQSEPRHFGEPRCVRSFDRCSSRGRDCCDRDFTCDSRSNTCRIRLGGRTCRRDSDCVSGLNCRGGTCVNPPPRCPSGLGDFCTNGNTSNRCCNRGTCGSRSRCCVVTGNTSTQCRSSLDCCDRNASCRGGRCIPPSCLPRGATCSTNNNGACCSQNCRGAAGCA